jgi:uncharacterized protein (TIGR02996 family)
MKSAGEGRPGGPQRAQLMKLPDAIRADILSRPDDDVPRLAYADWLDEHGGPAERDRAEFIRVQIDLERLPLPYKRREGLQRREGELLNAHRAAWLEELPR